MKRPVKKVKRFSEGGFSEAQEKWLGGADRTDPAILARMRSAVPDEVKEESKPTAIESSEETGNKGTATETTKVAAPKQAAPKQAAPKQAAPKVEVKEKVEPKVNGKTFSETIAASKSKNQDSPKKSEDKEDPKAVAKAYIEAAKLNTPVESNFPSQKTKYEPSGKAKANKDAGKPSKSPNRSYKSGGTVKRSSASKRADGCAIRGKTRA
jgi:hypothetical protein